MREKAGVLGLIVAHDVYYLVINLSAPVLDLHAVRQAQTAITAYWTLHGGLTHAFDTPVLGYPWAIPLEFPLYQWLVSAVAYLGIPIDAAGRLVRCRIPEGSFAHSSSGLESASVAAKFTQ